MASVIYGLVALPTSIGSRSYVIIIVSDWIYIEKKMIERISERALPGKKAFEHNGIGVSHEITSDTNRLVSHFGVKLDGNSALSCIISVARTLEDTSVSYNVTIGFDGKTDNRYYDKLKDCELNVLPTGFIQNCELVYERLSRVYWMKHYGFKMIIGDNVDVSQLAIDTHKEIIDQTQLIIMSLIEEDE